MKLQLVMCAVQSFGTIVSMVVAVIAFKTWKENRRSVEFELIERLDVTFEAKISEKFSDYFEGNKDFKVVKIGIYPQDARTDIIEILSWFSKLGMMWHVGIAKTPIINRYKYYLRKISGDVKVVSYIEALANHKDGCMMMPYYGFVCLASVFGEERMKDKYLKILKKLKV